MAGCNSRAWAREELPAVEQAPWSPNTLSLLMTFCYYCDPLASTRLESSLPWKSGIDQCPWKFRQFERIHSIKPKNTELPWCTAEGSYTGQTWSPTNAGHVPRTSLAWTLQQSNNHGWHQYGGLGDSSNKIILHKQYQISRDRDVRLPTFKLCIQNNANQHSYNWSLQLFAVQ